MTLLLLAGCGMLGGKNGEDSADEALCTEEGPGVRQLRRLTPVEIDNSVSDLLGVDAGAESTLAADDVVGTFANDASALDVSSLWADQMRQIAETVAWEADLSAALPCDPSAVGQAPCAAMFVEDFGLRAFRRPLSQADVDRYEALWETVASEEGFEEGIRWVLAAMLQSPHFLYRMELGEADGAGGYTLTGWEVATELSYLYWRTTPDATLLDAAASGALDTPEGVAAQVERLRADPRAAEAVADFFEAWLGIDQLDTVTRDGSVYPEFTEEVRASMHGETRRLIAAVAAEGGSLSDLFSANYTFVDPTLAAFYGIGAGDAQADAEGFRRVDLDGGILTQGSLLARWALPTTSSPIHRGKMVRERLLCQELPPPPANLDTSPPPVDPSLSTRERYAAHSELPECSGCHQLMDPVGFAFEHYDGVGRWRDMDGTHPVDATGEIVGSPHTNATFDGVLALSDVLGASQDVQACYATMWSQWATGVSDSEPVRCAAERLAAGSGAGELPLLVGEDGVVTSAQFTRRTGGAAEGDTPAAGQRLADLELPADDGPWADYAPPEPDPVEWTEDDQTWQGGFCTNVTVTNTGDTDVAWAIDVTLLGTVTSSWCATFSGTTVSGSDACGNTVLAPGASTTAGWCGSL